MEQKPPRPSTLSAALEQAAALLDSDPRAVQAQALDILKDTPGQQQALALIVLAAQRQGDLGRAQRVLESLAEATPAVAAIHYQLGLALYEMERLPEAAAALSRVVELEPRHPEAQRALARTTGQDISEQLDPGEELQNGIAGLQCLESAARGPNDQLPAAEALFREWLEIHPTDVWALQMLGNVYLRLKGYDDAEQALTKAVDLAPGFAGARWMLAGTFFYRGNWERALLQVNSLLENGPEKPEYLHLKSHALLHSGEFDAAIACREDSVAKYPSAESWAYLGQALRTVGRQQEAITAYRKAIAMKPDFGLAWWGLADLKTFRFLPADIESIKASLERGEISGQNRARLHFALGKAFEEEKQYELSFTHYDKGNAAVRTYTPHDANAWTVRMRASKRVFTEAFFRSRADWGSPANAPIFIVGLPRSGTTLLEQILASHSEVESVGELQALEWVAHRLTRGGHYPELLQNATADDVGSAADSYLAMTQLHRKLNRPFFIDKMPSNFTYLGLILLMFPKAKVIDARRHPLGSGFANFKHYMWESNSFAFGLADIGHYYRSYVELTAHLDAVAPDRVYRVFYERLVADTETETRRLLDYCGLTFEEACLRFYESKRAVLTPSSEQVRRPIYSDAAELWRHYEPWLGPLKSALGTVLEAYPDAPKFDEPAPAPEWRMSLGSANFGAGQTAKLFVPHRTPTPSR